MNTTGSITDLLQAHAHGDPTALAKLTPLAYQHLCRIARSQLSSNRRGMLDTNALVHEAYLKLNAQAGARWHDRDHFYAACAQAMRHILVDAARKRLSLKHGAGDKPTNLPDDFVLPEANAIHVMAVHEALNTLRKIHPDLCRVVECRFFAGFSGAETASALGVSPRTAHRLWIRARAWLKIELDTSVEPLTDQDLSDSPATALTLARDTGPR